MKESVRTNAIVIITVSTRRAALLFMIYHYVWILRGKYRKIRTTVISFSVFVAIHFKY